MSRTFDRRLFEWTKLAGCICFLLHRYILSIRSDPYYAKCIGYNTIGCPCLLCYPLIMTDIVLTLSHKRYELGCTCMDHVIWYRTRVVDGLSDSHTSSMSIYLHQCLESFSYWWVSVCICSCIILSSDMHIEIILYICGTLLSLTDHGIKQAKSIQGEE